MPTAWEQFLEHSDEPVTDPDEHRPFLHPTHGLVCGRCFFLMAQIKPMPCDCASKEKP